MPIEVAGPIAADPVTEDEVLGARRGADRIRLDKPEPVDGLLERRRREQAAIHGEAPQVVQGRDARCSTRNAVGGGVRHRSGYRADRRCRLRRWPGSRAGLRIVVPGHRIRVPSAPSHGGPADVSSPAADRSAGGSRWRHLCGGAKPQRRDRRQTTQARGALPRRAFDRAAFEITHQKFVLDNGLTLLIHEDHSVPVVGVNLWYHVGSRNEQRGKTGVRPPVRALLLQRLRALSARVP